MIGVRKTKTMKLKFQINYNTVWGENLYVAATYTTDDGRSRNYLLPMQTDDGEVWTLETSVMESRQRPVVSITYCYQVLDGDGRVLRVEWCKVPRTYAFDSSRDYFFPDMWRDVPLNAHLYTEAFQTTTCQRRHTPVSAERLSLFRRTIIFRVSAPQLLPGQSVGVCGSHPAIGGWNPSRFHRMKPMGDGEWMLSVNIEGMPLPLEFKYVVIDDATNQLIAWEEGDNRTTMGVDVADGQVLVLYREALRVCEAIWRAAGVAVPLFSLRTETSCGVGDFGDLLKMVDWASATGMKMIQLLPIADTTSTHSWTDSHPYNAISAFALHPHYIDLTQLPPLREEAQQLAYNRQRRELNSLSYSDYMAVDKVKMSYVESVFETDGAETLQSAEYKDFVEQNTFWLTPYAAFCILRDRYSTSRYTDWPGWEVYEEAQVRELLKDHPHERDKIFYLQYHLHRQLAHAVQYAHAKGVALMGDLPIGVYRDSVETWSHPTFFDMEAQMGTPPDNETINGQNWGFPAYRWTADGHHLETEAPEGIFGWMRARIRHWEQYFDAMRVDHAVGYFRIWEIPRTAVLATMGHFSPALPMSEEEITRYGLTFRRDLHTRPFINDTVLNQLFGIHAGYVRDHFLYSLSYGLYALREEYDTQVKIRDHFGGRSDENSLWIRDGMYRLIANVLFLEDPHMQGMYHPRFMVYNEPVYEILSTAEKDAFIRLYNNYYNERHHDFWASLAEMKLQGILSETRMLVCAEDLGMLPSCVGQVLNRERILSTEIQAWPKQHGVEFSHLGAFPYLSLCTLSTHDMAPLRLWWEENIGRSQRYFATMLQHVGRAPQQLPAHIAEEIIARHLYGPSMLCVLALQDWLAMDSELRGKNAADERINAPYDIYNQWKYRMSVTIEQLLQTGKYNHKIKTMITRSKR